MNSYRQDFLSIKIEGMPGSELFDIFLKALSISELTDMPVDVILSKTESIKVEKVFAFGMTNEQQANFLVDYAIKMREDNKSIPIAASTKSVDDIYKDFRSVIETLNKFAQDINNKKN